MKNKNILIFIVLLVSFIKGLMWIALIPLFDTPDEPVHFDYVQKIAETNKIFFNKYDKKDIYQSEEVDLAAKYSGLMRIYHSRLNKINFTGNETGENENRINTLPVCLRRTNTNISAISIQYPPLYYMYSSIPYNIFYNSSIITRVFAVRIFSLLLGLLTIFMVYKIAGLIFNKQKYIPAFISLLVSFNPMYTFISVSVNSDNLLTLLFTLFLYYYLKIFLTKYKIRDVIFLLFVLLLGIFTKQQFALSLIILFIPFCFAKEYPLKTKIIGGVVCFSFLFLAVLNLKNNFPVPVFIEKIGKVYEYFHEDFIPFFFVDMPYSFFGDFGWLNLPIPPLASRVLLVLSVTCILFYIFDIYKAVFKKRPFLPLKIHILLLIPLVIYTMSLVYIDCNIKFGLQGRYFFPIIAFIYICMTSGLLSVVSKKDHVKYLAVISVTAVLFNIYCLMIIILPRYYL
ncbi:MAG: hypothetical protein A2452_00410 [Candidatus Firestonebacteria bacterium RIFOXYC2_FULL_39_67]|nr:MAG: hypothetical protein A2536_03495 [Candidatus Firestonebacteria bacterium RIFOXYD2_FULL_39_29]OGF54996.1 MAG: hypothetical protein A2452_00410 [Candidatus Firestonebacteria bacterium RIFOXYC2_FULL_39_67]